MTTSPKPKPWSAFLFGSKTEPQQLPTHDPLMCARRSDPETSKAAARTIKPTKSQLLLLHVFYDHTREGGLPLTDRAAGRLAGVETAHKRCSELRRRGIVEVFGQVKCPETGKTVQTCRITRRGLDLVRDLGGAV